MGAAAWTKTARDITEDGPLEWTKYLTVEQLSDAIDLAKATILDSLARRNLQDSDPRSAIYRPAARVGQTALNATPLWTWDQCDRYITLAEARAEQIVTARRRKTAKGVGQLPKYNVAEVAERGLASMEELATITGYAENTLRRFVRENPDFPPEVGIAPRVPPQQYGPPRTLRSIGQVKAWLKLKEARDAAASAA